MQTRLADFVTARKPSQARLMGGLIKKPSSLKHPAKPRMSNWSWQMPWQLDALQRWFLVLLVALCGIGLFFVFEASTAESFTMVGEPYYFLRQQSIWMGLGLVPLLLGWFWPLSFWQRTALNWYGVAVAALIAVFLPGIGLHLNGAHRWLHVGGIVIQPAEFVKFAVVIFFASWMSKHQRIGAFLLFLGVPAGLILLQPDLGSLLVVLWIAFGMYVLAEGNLKKFLPIVGLGIIGLTVAILVSPYRLARLTTYLNPEADPLGAGFHIRQVTLALGNGGWWGQGLGNSTQKYLYIPEASSDSVFAIVAEEVGFLGSAGIILMFGALILIVLRLIQRAPAGSFGRLLGQGIFLWLSGQVILNLAAVVALVPLTGIPLPFFSYGGSSLLMLFFIMGLVLQISDPRRQISDTK